MAENAGQVTVRTAVDVGPLRAGMAQAAAATQTGAQTMADAMARVQTASQRLTAEIKAQQQVMAQYPNMADLVAEADARVAAAKQELAAASAAAGGAVADQAAAMQGGAAAATEYAGATDAATASTEAMTGAMAYGTIRAGAMAAGMGSMGYVFGRIGAQASGVANVMAAIFPAVVAGAIIDGIVRISQAVEKWYQDDIQLKAVNDDLLASAETGAKAAAAANWQYVNSVIALRRAMGDTAGAQAELQRNIGAKPFEFPAAKLKPHDYATLETAVPGAGAFLGQAKGVNTLTGAGAMRGAIAQQTVAATDALNRYLEKLRQLQAAQKAEEAAAESAAKAGTPFISSAGARGAAMDRLRGDITALQSYIAYLGTMMGTLSSAQGTAANEVAAAQAREASSTEKSARRQGGAMARTLREVQALRAGMVRQLDAYVAAQARIRDAAQRGSLNDLIQEEDAALKQARANAAMWDKIDAGIRRAAVSAGDWARQYGRMKQAQMDEAAREKAGARATAERQAKGSITYQGIISLGQSFDTMTKGVIMGTQRIGVAWRRMGADMVAGWVSTLVKIAAKHLAMEVAMRTVHAATVAQNTAISAAGAAQTDAISSASSMKQIAHAAAVAASKAWKALAGIPVVGPALGAAAAGATYAGVMAYGALASAAGGQWEVPGEQLTVLHPREQVLPAWAAGGMRRMIAAGASPGGGGAGPTMHFHYAPQVHAFDASGVDRVLGQHGEIFRGHAARIAARHGGR